MSHKIKFNLSNKKNKKQLEDQPNKKISISIDRPIANTSQVEQLENKKPIPKKNLAKAVSLDNNLYKQFKNNQFNKIDLHGLTVDHAHHQLIQYLKTSYLKKNLFHIIVTGLGNKADGGEFFTGKIRKQFPFWLDTEEFQFMVKSYSPCKIQHGGLGAFYVKLKLKE